MNEHASDTHTVIFFLFCVLGFSLSLQNASEVELHKIRRS